MKVVHYTLGLPPARSGGLVQYTTDLARAQALAGIDVTLIYPGSRSLVRPGIHFGKIGFNADLGVNVVQMINSLPLAIFGGIKTPADFMKHESISTFIDLFQLLQPDCIHLHTLMGLPIEFLKAAKRLSIPVILTTHDYYGIAPEPTFYFQGESYDFNNTSEQWAKISMTAMSTWKLHLFQSSLYPAFRLLVRKLKSVKNSAKEEDIHASSQAKCEVVKPQLIERFDVLRKYYLSFYRYVDLFHFNSSLTKSVFESQLGPIGNGVVIPLSNSHVRPHTVPRTASKKIRVAFFGQATPQKGFPMFVALAKKLPASKFSFNSYGYVPTYKLPEIKQHGRYTVDQLDKIYSQTDIVVVPSQCKETFGFVAVEAIASGIPTLVSNNVGAKDFVSQDCVFDSLESLLEKVMRIREINVIRPAIDDLTTHMGRMSELYKRLCNDGIN